jgi:hypothetical protein
MTTYRIHALEPAALDQARAAAGTERSLAGGGEPLRCCLRDAHPGEPLLLFGYAPPLPPSPYREVGAVFAHAAPCPGRDPDDGYPADWYGRPQVLRAYDAHGRIHPATRVHDGTDPRAAIVAVLGDPEVVQVHSRNVAYGCFMFRIQR